MHTMPERQAAYIKIKDKKRRTDKDEVITKTRESHEGNQERER